MALTKITGNVVKDNTLLPEDFSPGKPLWNTTGYLTATKFFGDGSLLAGITATGDTTSTVINVLTSTTFSGYLSADAFVGDGTYLTNIQKGLSVIEVTDNYFSVEPKHNNCIVFLNNPSTINIDTLIYPETKLGHYTIFVQYNQGQGFFISPNVFNSSEYFATKQLFSVSHLLYYDFNRWILFSDSERYSLTAAPFVPPPPPLTPISTYTLGSNLTSVNEGALVTVDLSTTNVSDSNIPYTVIGTINTSDLSGNSAGITGNFNLVNNFASIVFALSSDAVTEGTEFINLRLDNGQAAIAVQVNDTSRNVFYTLTRSPSSTTFNEGDTVTVTLSAQNAPNGTSIPYYVQTWGSGNVNINDFVIGSSDALTGNFITTSEIDSKTFVFSNDALTEGNEIFFLTLSNQGASISVTLLDTSIFIPQFTQIAVGAFHSLALSGTDLYVCGADAYGQHGLSVRADRSRFTRVGGKWDWIGAGRENSYALSGNQLFVTGDNSTGVLGLGDTNPRSTFTRVPNLNIRKNLTSLNINTLSSIAVASTHVVVLCGDTLFGAGAGGPLGFASLSARSTFTKIFWTNERWSQVAAARNLTALLSTNNTGNTDIWYSGYFGNSPSGIGTGLYRSTFTKITDPLNGRWSEIAAGELVIYALSGTDLYYIGGGVPDANRDLVFTSTFTKLTAGLLDPKFTAIDPVTYTTNNIINNLAALSGTDLYVKGNANNYYQLGLGFTSAKSTFTKITTPGSNWLGTACGTRHSLALSANNTLYTCGWNFFGALGQGTSGSNNTSVLNYSIFTRVNTVIQSGY